MRDEGRWKMENGKWGNGEMEGGKWKVEGGRWKIENRELGNWELGDGRWVRKEERKKNKTEKNWRLRSKQAEWSEKALVGLKPAD